MKSFSLLGLVAGMMVMAGCSGPQEIAGGAVETGGGALNTAGAATAEAADATGEAAMQVLGTAGEATAAATRGIGEAATQVTGGEGGAVKEVKGVANEIGKKRNVDFMGNDVVIDPSEDKKIRMAF